MRNIRVTVHEGTFAQRVHHFATLKQALRWIAEYGITGVTVKIEAI